MSQFKQIILNFWLFFLPLLGISSMTYAEKLTERSFDLGFTYQPYDWSEQAFEDTYNFIEQNGDLIFHYFDDGVPWPEAFANSDYHSHVDDIINTRIDHVRDNQKVALGVNFLAKNRLSLAAYWGEQDSLKLPDEWANKGINHPDVITAYVAYCRSMIQRFQPDYFIYGMEIDSVAFDIESNEFLALENMIQTVYTKLHHEFPDLPLVLSFVLLPEQDMQQRKHIVKRLLPYSDIYAVSLYPYLFDGIAGDADKLPKNLLSRARNYIGDKPFAIAETGFNAKTWHVKSKGINIPGNESSQANYVNFLLQEANTLNALFVNWWVPRDLDKLWIKMEAAGADPMFSQWNSNGLVDAQGKPRPGLAAWRSWLKKEISPTQPIYQTDTPKE